MKKQKKIEKVNWLGLPDNVLYLISRKFNVVDYVSFGSVCLSWRLLYVENRRHKVPCLLINNTNEDNRHYLYSVTDKRMISIKVPDGQGNYYGSSHGWLITTKRMECQVNLVNPFTRTEIQLPSFRSSHEIRDDNNAYLLHRAFLSADPISNPNNYVVMAIGSRIPRNRILSWCRDVIYFSPVNKMWKSLTALRGLMIQDAIYHQQNQQFYVVSECGRVYSCDVNDPNLPNVSCISPPCDVDGIKYLVESKGELLQIVRYNNAGFQSDSCSTDGFTVLKLDSESWNWVKVKNLSGQVLFVGDNSSLSLPVSDLPGCEPNSIYFTNHNCLCFHDYKSPPDMGIFHVEDGLFEPHFEKTKSMHFSTCNPIWILPSL